MQDTSVWEEFWDSDQHIRLSDLTPVVTRDFRLLIPMIPFLVNVRVLRARGLGVIGVESAWLRIR